MGSCHEKKPGGVRALARGRLAGGEADVRLPCPESDREFQEGRGNFPLNQ
jgi:hypothetical protein